MQTGRAAPMPAPDDNLAGIRLLRADICPACQEIDDLTWYADVSPARRKH
jgi:hypothetical protein